MFHNYLVIALRNLARHKLFSFINIIGLTVGLACVIFVVLFVRDALSYDSWIPGSQNIYRVGGIMSLPGEKPFQNSATPFPIVDAAMMQIPEVKAAAHLEPYEMTVVAGNRQFIDHVDVVSPNFFQVIQLPLVAGDPAQVFAQPESAVISERAARKYFGDGPAIGKTLHAGGMCEYGAEVATEGCKKHDATVLVTGVMRDLPHNTQLTGDVFFPYTSAADPMAPFRKQRDWIDNHGWGYVALTPAADIKQVTAKFAAMVDRNFDPKQILNLDIKGSKIWMPILTPFRDDHLTTDQYGSLTPAGSLATVYGFSAVGVLILLVACFNFTNLATAQATARAKEISLRKVLGARRSQLAAQFLGESVLIALISLALAMSLTEVLLPSFDHAVGIPIALDYLHDWPLTLALIGLAIVTGLIAGAYPSAILSGFRPAQALRANASGAHGSSLVRTSLVVLQFAVSIGLGIATLVVFEQISFVRALDLGLDKENVVVVSAFDITPTARQSLVHDLNADPALRGATLSANPPFSSGQNNAAIQMPGQSGTSLMRVLQIAPNFFSVYHIPILRGRALSESRAQDEARNDSTQINVIVNRAAAARLGYAPAAALGEFFFTANPKGSAAPRRQFVVVGVTDNFKFKGDLEDVTPTFYEYSPGDMAIISVRIPAGGVPRALAAIDRAWHGFAPSIAINRHFLDDDFQNLFAAQEKQEKIFSLFVSIAIVIACLGLFGLAAFTAGRRTKEIGIRKCFGARTRNIVLLLLWQFSIPVLIANAIAWPLAWYYLHGWLESFAYRITLSPLYFLGAGLVALAIAWTTIFTHAYRIASVSPVSALHYE